MNINLKKTGSKIAITALLCTCILIGLFELTQGQVVIVQNKLKTPRPTGKIKAKPRQKTRTQTVSTTFASRSATQPIPPLTFAVVLPAPLKTTSLVPTTTPTPLPIKLQNYEFDVVTLDARGNTHERRRETSRYFVEEIKERVGLEMVEIPTGMFMMGSTGADFERIKKDLSPSAEKELREALFQKLQTEIPQKTIKIPTFHLSKYEVTQAQWRAVASLPKVARELMSDPSHFKGGNRPVEQISWEEAVEFCERLSRATGRKYRLPTEAEWEYACRAGTNSSFSFGETLSPEWGNFNGRLPYAEASKGLYREQTTLVGSLKVANAFGLYDMHGNVREWCLDSWHNSYGDLPEDGSAWEKDGDGFLRVLRGGAWNSAAGECRSAARNKLASSVKLNTVGFRVVAEAEPAK